MKQCFQAIEHAQRPVLPEKSVEEAIAALPRLPAWSFQAHAEEELEWSWAI